jgi:leader peptidase (prepilin peptidase)/N-methyltransferase
VDFFLILYAGAIGLIVGSYLNVVIYRLPAGISTVLPASRCPRCHTRIRVRDNVPVVSFLLLRGRCRACRYPIRWRYPLVETATGLLFVSSWVRFGLVWETVVAAVFCSIMVALAMIDLEHFLLPDALTLPGIALGIACSPVVTWTNVVSSVLGAALGVGALRLLIFVWFRLRKEQGMGLGDVKMLGTIGAFLGAQLTLVALLVASLTGAVVALTLLLSGKMTRKGKLPFGFFLALGALVALFFGPGLLDTYLHWL